MIPRPSLRGVHSLLSHMFVTNLQRPLHLSNRGSFRQLCSDAAEAATTPRHRLQLPKQKNLYDLASILPRFGVGSRFFRNSWARKGYDPVDYHWEVTRVVLRQTDEVRSCYHRD